MHGDTRCSTSLHAFVGALRARQPHARDDEALRRKAPEARAGHRAAHAGATLARGIAYGLCRDGAAGHGAFARNRSPEKTAGPRPLHGTKRRSVPTQGRTDTWCNGSMRCRPSSGARACAGLLKLRAKTPQMLALARTARRSTRVRTQYQSSCARTTWCGGLSLRGRVAQCEVVRTPRLRAARPARCTSQLAAAIEFIWYGSAYMAVSHLKRVVRGPRLSRRSSADLT